MIRINKVWDITYKYTKALYHLENKIPFKIFL